MPSLARAELTELHCIQPISNVASILELGILSNYGARQVKHESIADQIIQDRREPVVVPGTNGRKLHSYANLYVNARNKTLWKMKFKHGDLGMCVLSVDLDVLDLPDVIVASQNASSDYARFAPAPGGLSLIDKDLVFARSWKHPDDQIQEWKHGSIMCAEVLVPDVVEPEHISGAYVSSKTAHNRLRASLNDDNFSISIDEDLFFRL